ncbi:MAG: hypothetical protein K0R18_20 [Bacillales bacterium]|jgi:hypothetical protein|nr:hypothetical protein [Bacillales bacterium]
MSDFMKEVWKRKKEEDRIENIHKKGRIVSQKLLDEVESLCTMLTLTTDKLEFESNKFQTIICEKNSEISFANYSIQYNKVFTMYDYLSKYIDSPAAKITIRKIKGNKSIIELHFRPSDEILDKLKKMKSVKLSVMAGSYYFDRIEITIGDLDELIDRKIFTKILMMLVNEIIKEKEVS